MHVISRDAFGSLFTHLLDCFLLLHTDPSRQLIATTHRWHPEVARAPLDALANDQHRDEPATNSPLCAGIVPVAHDTPIYS
jgi:hypothetical protein